jgi:transposase
MPDGTIKKKVTSTDQRQMVYYSEKYARKQKRDREVMIERAKDLINHPKKYDKVTAAGSAAYIKNIKFNAETGEVIGNNLRLDIEKIIEEEKYDGYYSIVTSELNLSAAEIRNIYRGLIRIEHTFRITKSELEFRPIYLWTSEHIKAHFTVCFTALYILKILMKLTNDEYTAEKILNAMNQCTVSDIGNNLWQFNYYDDCLAALSAKLDITLNYRYRTREQVRRILKY